MTPLNTPDSFGSWVRSRRRQLDLTQLELGKRAGCSEAAIRKIEANERKPSHQLAGLLADALLIPASEKEPFIQYARGLFPAEINIQANSGPKPNNLPTLITSTIDRRNDLENVSALLYDKTVHLITIIGTPGIGKTRLSIHCGYESLDDFRDGVWFVDLAETTNPDFFIPTIARSLGSQNILLQSGLSQLISWLRTKHLLLILDNFEQIVDQSGLEVAQILKDCPSIKILVTSRVPLHIYGEHEYLLPPLSLPPPTAKKDFDLLRQSESVQLFLARIRQHQPEFNLTLDNAAAVIEICIMMEGIPLALELAAATLRQMTLEEIVSILHGSGWVKYIASYARDLPSRQRTIENVIEWSYSLLDEEQRIFFCKLGIFTSWFDADAAAVVSETELTKVVAFLNSLANQSLLVRNPFKGRTYWRMLEPIHEYIRSRLTRLEHLELLRARYFLEKTKELKKTSTRSFQDDYFQINIANFNGILRWAIAGHQTELGFEFANQLNEVWASLGYFKEGLDFIRQLLAIDTNLEPRLRTFHLQNAADMAWQQHDFETAVAFSRESVDLGRKHGMKAEYPWYLNRLGRIYIEQGKLSEAKEILQEALKLAYENPSILNPGSPLAQLGEAVFFDGKLDEAKILFEKALTYLSLGDEIFLAVAKTDLAEIALTNRDYGEVRKWLVEALEPASMHIRRSIVFLSTLAGYLVLSPEGSNEKAACFYGAVDALNEQSSVILGPFFRSLNQRRILIVQQDLSESHWQKAFDVGRQWDKDNSFRQAKLELDSRDGQVDYFYD